MQPLSEWQTCSALKYPRSLSGLLSTGEARAMTAFYHQHIHPRMSSDSSNIYGHLLEAGLRGAPGSELAFGALNNVWLRTAKRLGIGASDFVVAADFFSVRSPSRSRLFAEWHQDYAFWMTGARCTGFNLWILLDHRHMNHSFDVYDVQHVPQLYKRVYESAERAARACPHSKERCDAGHAGAAAFLNSRPIPSSSSNSQDTAADLVLDERQVSNVPLGVGDALVLKQLEIHRTDPLVHEGQWRLALGLKILERVPLVRVPRGTRLGLRLEQLRSQWPALLQRPTSGNPFPDWYSAVGSARNLSSSLAPYP